MPTPSTSARVVRFHKTGGPDVLQLDTIPVPPPGPGEVQIRPKALGLNRAESMFRSGIYLEQPRFPAKIGYEAAGIVEAVGPGVAGFRPGDPVSVIPPFDMNDYGVDAELANVPSAVVVHHPPSLSFTDAAAVWMQYLTAYGALIDIAHLQAGDTLLIPAASSSVGLAAIQIANMVGATPVALTRHSSKAQPLRDAGAPHVIATEEQDLVQEVLRLTNGQGARVVFDPVGGPTVAKLTAAMADRGILFLYGALSTDPIPLPLFDVLSKQLTVQGYLLAQLSADPHRLARATRFVNAGLAYGKLKPLIAKTFPLDQIADAHRYLESNQQIGKIVVTV
jgi:NADPH:quinone reductase-like Zn-dependent oxidoreductase